MNNTPDVPDDVQRAAAIAQRRLDHLNAKAEAMRAVLVQLLQDIVHAETRLDLSQASQLLEANENLIVSALGAQTEAETANGALDEASRTGRLDPLTSLPNRTVLMDRFESAISLAKRHGNRVALLFLDLDGFKRINDSFGHAAGDRALQRVADCLSSLVRATDTVSRHGGDEFLILLAEVASASEAAHVASKVNASLATQNRADGRLTNLKASIGISVYPDDGDDPKTLIDRADAAMYRAKKTGLGGFMFYGHRPASAAALAPANDTPLPPRRLNADAGERDRTSAQPTSHPKAQLTTQLRDANEALLMAALDARELLAAAESAKARQTELLAVLANELSDPFAPIDLAVSALGISDVEATLLARVRSLVEAQADHVLRRLGQVLAQQGGDDLQEPPD